jgi:hypothetical protein
MPSGHGRIPYPRLRAALDAGDLGFVRRYAREQGPLNLADALQVCLVIREREPERYQRAAVRWIGRFALEAREASVEDVRVIAEVLDELPDHPEAASMELGELCARHRISFGG